MTYPEKLERIGALLSGLEALDNVHAEQRKTLTDEIEALKKQVKPFVLKKGETLTSDTMMAVYKSPYTKWNTKGLEGACLIDQDLAAKLEPFKTMTEPTVAFTRR